MTTDKPKPVPAIRNAAIILRYLAHSGEAEGVTTIARSTGLSVSSTFTILRTLAGEELVSFDPETKTYRIGMGMIGLVSPLLAADPFDIVRPTVAEVADDLGVMIALWQVTEDEHFILRYSVVSRLPLFVSMREGARVPAYVGAVGRCYAAMTGITEAATRKKFDGIRWQNPPSFEDYWRDVEACRETGFAFDYGNLFTGANFAATLACDQGGRPRIGLSSISLAGQFTQDRMQDIALRLKDLARRIEANVFGATAPSDRRKQ
ncbi:IclR family transcriptional regulator [Oceanicola sp. 22II-s10i]|uniref:IclR family transcriptional regulator n=1 Tax=Oceanicola sp. 22II-s10i TaxID=1317116 RepID=UPI000B528073|nr:helix-turn-helix domain-containing protein [Oceanicola sp. 22II-s10i]